MRSPGKAHMRVQTRMHISAHVEGCCAYCLCGLSTYIQSGHVWQSIMKGPRHVSAALLHVGAVEEAATPDFRFSAPSAFNGMSLHVFPQARVVVSGLFSSTEGS